MPAKIAKTHNLSPELTVFKRTADISWCALVFVWADSEEECDNPRCSRDVEMKQAHLLNGQIVIVQVCFPCGQQLALRTGMVDTLDNFAIVGASP